MNRLKMALFPCVLITVLATFLLRPVVAQAVIPGACGGWSIVPSPNVPLRTNSLSGVAAVSANDVWAVGTDGGQKHNIFTLIEHWNGTQWSIVPSPNPGHGTNRNQLEAVSAVSANDVWAVGFGGTSDGTLIVHWDGTQWRLVSHPPFPSGSQLTDVTALSANDVWAVGTFINSSGDNRTLIVHWDGTQWSIVASPNVGLFDSLRGVTAVSASDIWAVGGVGIDKTLTEHWNGTRWSVVASPSPGSNLTELVGVVALSTQNVWAVGLISLNNAFQALIEHWDGTQWSVVPNPGSGVQLAGVTIVPNSSDLWTVGINGANQTLTEFYC